ncbi:MAG: response regulator [Acidobacteria bacterium]|nr:response regulator [Acidobacteriota bacterium]MBV9070140.1 response regulator [Acidobacteriota bacterium]MBV9186315.1 response regulator [Acidobacteriota bacterium]
MTGDREKRALVIDDDDHIRELLQALLETAGYTVDLMRDGIDAVDMKEREYAVILLDMKMPIFDGARLTDYWKLTNPAVLRRVILLSGYSRLSSNRDFGTFAVIEKPFEYRELLNAVDACFRQARAMCADSGHFTESESCPQCSA